MIEADTETEYSLHDIQLTAYLADDLSPIRSSTKSFRELVDVMDCIKTLGIKATVHAHVYWEYEKDSYETLIKLPTLRTTGEMPFDFISGMRFVKKVDNDFQAFVLDTQRSGQLTVSATIPLEEHSISLETIDHILDKAAILVRDFVTER